MKISLDWLKDHVALPDDLSVAKLMHDLTMTTVEVEGAESLKDRYNGIIVGRIAEVLPHPNADKLRICRTDIGGGEIKEIVCGGSNLAAGMKVVVACPGAMVRWHGEGDLVEIKASKLRGVESYGMICASTEIGMFDLFPFDEPATIIDLSAFDAEPGANICDALGIDDVILEIDNKSLTNRPDLWGHYGIARELAAIYGLPLKPIPAADVPHGGDLRVAIADSSRCFRYEGFIIEGVSPKPSDFKIQTRIWRVGMRPINALVDITNYVMLDVGQPTHAFDRDNIKGGITVRRASEGESLALLNGAEVKLTPDDLVIADDAEAVALAGIMGGSKDSILPSTKNVILEIATFDALGTRKTAQRNELRTEASMRYEKGLDPQRVDQASARALALFAAEFPDMRVTARNDCYPAPLAPAEIDVSLSWLAARVGRRLPDDEVRGVLACLGFEVSIDGDAMRVTAPSWRSTGDVSLPDDIMEEVARLHGYENFEPAPITTSFAGAINQPREDLPRRVREYLSFRCGMNEIFTYPWLRDDLIDAAGLDRSEMLEISTPPAPNERMLRSSLVPGILGAVASNARYFDDFSLYELTQVFFNRDFAPKGDERELLPRMRRHVCGAFARAVSSPEDTAALYREAKGVIEAMPRLIHAEPLAFAQAARPAWADETVWLNITSGGEPIGALALLSKRAALAVGIKQLSVMIFELDADALIPLPSRANRFEHLPEFPQNDFDISMLFDDAVRWEQIAAAAITKNDLANKDWPVRSVSFVGEYRGKQIPEGKKSVTLRLVIGSDKRTMTGAEIEKAAAVVSKRLIKQLGGEQRA